MIGSASLGVALAAAGQGQTMQGGGGRRPSRGDAGTCSTPRSAVARTQYGKVRGFVADDVLHFKGIPYGDDTGGANRWLPAKAPPKWDGEYPALAYGANCPQLLHNFRDIEHTFLQQWTDGFVGEDMLKLNLWTPSLSGSRPVMVYFHGGGFSFGSAYELESQHGANMARNHDVVQITVNHRLNVLGFFDLAEFGGRDYAQSVNCSMMDCVAALRWVQENIASFGGDPDRVLIYGQSGGGAKVATLLGMPSAKGLIHRGIAQSGGGGNIPSAEQTRDYTRRLIKDLGVRDMADLQKMDWARLNATATKVANDISGAPNMGAMFLTPPGSTPPARVGFTPTVDGEMIKVRSFFDVAPDEARTVPLMVGSVTEEGAQLSRNPTESEWRTQLGDVLGATTANTLIDAMKRAHPEKSIRTLSYGVSGLGARNNVVRAARLKHAQGGAPAYQYLFQWQSPMLDGLAGAWHTAELAFCFDNTARCNQGTGNTPAAQALATKMAGAWAAFAHAGNPSQPGLAWEPSDPVRNQTMIFDDRCGMMDDPEGGLRRILQA